MSPSTTEDPRMRAGAVKTARKRLDEIEGIELSAVAPAPPALTYTAAGIAVGVGVALGAGPAHWVIAAVAGSLTYLVATYLIHRTRCGARVAVDQVMRGLIYGAFALALLPLVSLLSAVISNGASTALNVDFLTQTMNGVTGLNDQRTQRDGVPMVGGAYHAIMGTLIITGLAGLISIPIGMFTSIYLVEYGSKGRLSHAIRFFVDVMTGIPSIVAGLFAFALWAVLFGIGTKNGMAGAVALSVLMIPTVVRNSEEMLRIVPNELREAALALGVPKWRTIVKVVLPTAASGLAAGITLAIARVIGETAPLLVAVGYARSLNVNATDGPMSNLAVYAYYMFTKPLSPAYRDPSTDRAWAAALLLVLIVVLLNLFARWIATVFAPKTGR